VSYKGRTIVASADQPMGSVNGRVVTLPAPVARIGRRLFVPIDSSRARWRPSTTRQSTCARVAAARRGRHPRGARRRQPSTRGAADARGVEVTRAARQLDVSTRGASSSARPTCFDAAPPPGAA